MRSLAAVYLARGYRVGGSDPAYASLPRLIDAGAVVYGEPDAARVPLDAELVVYSDAVPVEHVERRRAAELGIPTLSYFECLGRMMQGKHGLAVAGTHGKSTVTAMTAEILIGAGLDPTVVYGAARRGEETGGRAGGGPAMLVEACEYRANFLHLAPNHAVVLDIEPDHFDYFQSEGQLERAFGDFAAKLPRDGLLLAANRPVVRRVAERAVCRVEFFGQEPDADWTACEMEEQDGRFRFVPAYRGRRLGTVRLQMPGRHNVFNALAAAALASHQGAADEAVIAGLEGFPGLVRRMEERGEWGGVAVVDDFAHHPTEVVAGLSTARRMYPGRRLWCVFQPHQGSRTARLLDEFARSLHNAHKVVVTDVFRAREPPAGPGDVGASDLVRKMRSLGTDATDVRSPEAIVDLLVDSLVPGDVLIAMGAGDIRRISDGFIDRIRKDRAAG